MLLIFIPSLIKILNKFLYKITKLFIYYKNSNTKNHKAKKGTIDYDDEEEDGSFNITCGDCVCGGIGEQTDQSKLDACCSIETLVV